MPSPDRTTSRFGDPRRWSVFAFGVTTLVVGISLTIAADLGVGSWQVLETGLVETTGLPFAVVAIIESIGALVVAWAWLRQPPWIATAVLAFAGVGIGALLDVLETPTSVLGQLVMLGFGIVALTTGLSCYLASDLGASAQDALFVGLYEKYRLRPSRVRFGLDASLVVIGGLLGGQFGAGTAIITIAIPGLIDPALRIAHAMAGTQPPAALAQPSAVLTQPPATSAQSPAALAQPPAVVARPQTGLRPWPTRWRK